MANARQIKRRIAAAANISKITKAMQMVAASKMRRAQDQATAARPYARAIQESLQRLADKVDASLHPLLAHHEQGEDILVLLSTDKGLCGSLNTNLFKTTLQWHKQHPTGKVVAIGRKAIHFCRVAGIPLHAQFANLPEKIALNDILPLTSLIMNGFLKQEFRHVWLVYMDFINTLSQQVRLIQLLPLKQGDVYQDSTMTTPMVSSEYIFEPNPQAILDELLPYYVENSVFQSFLEARASEHSARMVTMKSASENASQLVDELKLEFNKSRQSAITNELLDITTASLTIN